MPNKVAVLVDLGDYYGSYTDYTNLNYAYKNSSDMTDYLINLGWKVYTAITDEIATKEYCIAYLKEKIATLQPEDWLLFYYVGHGNQYIISDNNEFPVYMVTSLYNVTADINSAESYFTDKDYGSIVNQFKTQAPNGHLITILDCCFAFGIIDDYDIENSFHTVFAASNGDVKSAYTDNSFFFKSFKKAWNRDSFTQIKNAVVSYMKSDFNQYAYHNVCNIQIATNFENDTF